MTTEAQRIANQLREVFSGEPWYGHPLTHLLAGTKPEDANAHALPSMHSIWELVLHMELWARISLEATQDVPMPKLYGTEKDWISVEDDSAEEWAAAQRKLFQTVESLADTMDTFPDSRLPDTVPGREYSFAYLFYGIVQHSVYHFGQVAMAKAAARSNSV